MLVLVILFTRLLDSTFVASSLATFPQPKDLVSVAAEQRCRIGGPGTRPVLPLPPNLDGILRTLTSFTNERYCVTGRDNPRTFTARGRRHRHVRASLRANLPQGRE